ncbi:hypothetical protein EDEG_01144 [Edhazardia aedis USNM 41457]|uniref:Uncharacterized protein n=1 Tax=Edhazardia aedis (strain USNM 41457) TaxID=1003232 RepID=J8ZYD2_EDHAE|nr:hypothetical protein EDEG_01144 [Edhazardia aedis USNM 41457]|eukprot:EJW04653.1 hypothetical protein EDEG_01144 [Edhazardia aedis USNM 41457]
MNFDYCEEYAAGLCTNELFCLKGITQQCTKNHLAESREAYVQSKVLIGFEKQILNKFNVILNDVASKITHMERVFKNMETNNYLDAYNEVNSVLENDPDNYSLVRLKGLLVNCIINQNRNVARFLCCRVCGAVCVKDKNCEHSFHQAYVKLRDKCKELRERINKMKSDDAE